MNKENKTIAASLPETRGIYQAPVMEAIEVKVEQGFAQTTGGGRSITTPDSGTESDPYGYTW